MSTWELLLFFVDKQYCNPVYVLSGLLISILAEPVPCRNA
jgi:hypothetical protein